MSRWALRPGTKDILGLWTETSEGQILASRHERAEEPGIDDTAVVDGLKGLVRHGVIVNPPTHKIPDAIARWPASRPEF